MFSRELPNWNGSCTLSLCFSLISRSPTSPLHNRILERVNHPLNHVKNTDSGNESLSLFRLDPSLLSSPSSSPLLSLLPPSLTPLSLLPLSSPPVLVYYTRLTAFAISLQRSHPLSHYLLPSLHLASLKSQCSLTRLSSFPILFSLSSSALSAGCTLFLPFALFV